MEAQRERQQVAELTCATHPYPSQWQRHLVLGDDWRIFVRPIKPDDEPLIHDLLVHVSKQDLRLRFFDSIRELSPSFIARLTHIDYANAMAFVAIDEGSAETLAWSGFTPAQATKPASMRSC
jgi:acetyltransferase